MTKRAPPKSKLSLVSIGETETPLAPPPGLGVEGRDLWMAVTSQYFFDDPGSIEVLKQAVAAVDRAARCGAIISKEGEMVRCRGGTKSHPLLRDECANRALASRLISKLGLDLEPVRAVGRPGGGLGVA
jgi:hypothetical protein